jgi:hypothetical protein
VHSSIVVALIFPRGDCIDARQRKAAKASRLVARAPADRSSRDGPELCCSYGGGLGVLRQAQVGAASAKQVLPE